MDHFRKGFSVLWTFKDGGLKLVLCGKPQKHQGHVSLHKEFDLKTLLYLILVNKLNRG